MTPNNDNNTVEVVLNPACTLDYGIVRTRIQQLLQSGGYSVFREGPIDISSCELLQRVVVSCTVVDLAGTQLTAVPLWRCEPCIHVFQLSSGGAEQETIDCGQDSEDVNGMLCHFHVHLC
jgi:hypothetical protein